MTEYLDWIAGALGAAFGWYFGAFDGLFYALITLVITDYITGVLAAYTQKKLSSSEGFKGIAKKIGIFLLVGVTNVLDREFLGGHDLRAIIVGFYLANEGLSILENAVKLGVPVPDALKDKLSQLHGSSQETSNDKNNKASNNSKKK